MATAPASGCANDACSIWTAGKFAAIALLPLFTLPSSPENYTSLRIGSIHTVEHHRLGGMTTGRSKCSSAFDKAIGHQRMAGRHCMWPVGQKFLQNLQLTAAEGKAVYGMEF